MCEAGPNERYFLFYLRCEDWIAGELSGRDRCQIIEANRLDRPATSAIYRTWLKCMRRSIAYDLIDMGIDNARIISDVVARRGGFDLLHEGADSLSWTDCVSGKCAYGAD